MSLECQMHYLRCIKISSTAIVKKQYYPPASPSTPCNQSKLQLCVRVHTFDVSHSLQCKLFVSNWITFQVALGANDMPRYAQKISAKPSATCATNSSPTGLSH